MRFLLTAINAKYIHSNPAIYSLRAYAGKELQEHIELAEYTINQYPQDILADLYRRKPDAIGFSCYIWNWRLVQELLAELPKLLPAADLWLGGPEVTYNAPEILAKYPQLTGIMIGEGEATFRQLLQSYVGLEENQRSESDAGLEEKRRLQSDAGPEGSWQQMSDHRFAHIPGLCLPGGYTPARDLLDMSDIPFLYENLEPFANKIIYYESSRGCPYRCSYCLSSIDKRVRLRDISVVKGELQFFLDNRVKQVKFVDRTFNCNHEHAMAVWQYLYEHDNGVTNFHFEISADILREDELALLQKLRPGLAQLEIGVQSVNPETIRAIHRVMDVDRLEQAVAAIRKGQNIHIHLDLIAGLPYEDYVSFGRSFNRVYAMGPEQLQLGFLKVLKGSDMHERAAEYGIRYLDNPPYEVLATRWLSFGELLQLKGVEAMVELYYNSNQFTHTLPFLERAFPTPFAMFEAMAAFYEEKGYFVNSPARVHRYQVLLEFAERFDGEHGDVYRELLTYDMYLRENLKSRPDFAADASEEELREAIRDFYRKEEETRRFLPDYGEYDWKQLSKMTHLERFVYPVWDRDAMTSMANIKMNITRSSARDAMGDFEGRERQAADAFYVLFDYRSRNPLNREARTQVVTWR